LKGLLIVGTRVKEVLHWESFEWLRHQPSEEYARTTKRAFDFLTRRQQPDQGGTHEGFLRLKDAYDRAMAAFRHATS
jgi:hypothetical protein